MPTNFDDMLPSAKIFAEKVALAEAEEAPRLTKQKQERKPKSGYFSTASRGLPVSPTKKASAGLSPSSSGRRATVSPKFRSTVFPTICARTAAERSTRAKGMGDDVDRCTEGNLRALEQIFSRQGLQAEGRDCRVSQRRSGRCRHDAQVGDSLWEDAPEQSPLAAAMEYTVDAVQRCSLSSTGKRCASAPTSIRNKRPKRLPTLSISGRSQARDRRPVKFGMSSIAIRVNDRRANEMAWFRIGLD